MRTTKRERALKLNVIRAQLLKLGIPQITDYGRPVKKLPSLHGRKSNPNPKFLDMAEAYFVCYIGPKFYISLIYAFIGCP